MPSQQSLIRCKPFYSCLYYSTLLFSSHFPNLSALYWILIPSSKVLLNTLPGNSIHKEHELLFPLATCLPLPASVHALFPCQGCAVQNMLMVTFFLLLQHCPFLCEMSNLLKTILHHGKPWTLNTTKMSRNARKYFPFLISKVYSSLWPQATTSLLGCNRNESALSPRGVPITDSGTFSETKGHRWWGAVRCQLQHSTL